MSPLQLYHTVLRMDLAGTTPYERHQRIAPIMSKNRAATRDYLFAVSDDEQEVYVRSAEPRIEASGWREMALPRQGQVYRASALLWIDASRFGERWRHLWRTGFAAEGRIRDWLSPAFEVADLALSFEPSVALGKPGVGRVYLTPIRMSARVLVRDEPAAAHIAARGIGHGKAFGYGCVFFAQEG